MKSSIVFRVCLLFAVLAIAWVPATATSVKAAAEGGAGEANALDSAEEGGRIVVYYFHGARRCKTCRTIEAYTEEVVNSRFGKALESGSLVWKVVDYDRPENEHFIKEFGLVSASLVDVEMDGDERVRFDVLQKAWSLVRDKEGFERYVHQAVLDYLG